MDRPVAGKKEFARKRRARWEIALSFADRCRVSSTVAANREEEASDLTEDHYPAADRLATFHLIAPSHTRASILQLFARSCVRLTGFLPLVIYRVKLPLEMHSFSNNEDEDVNYVPSNFIF